jgi:hypothetical protein
MYLSNGAPMHVRGLRHRAPGIVRPLGPEDTPKKLWDQVKPVLGPDDKLFPVNLVR